MLFPYEEQFDLLHKAVPYKWLFVVEPVANIPLCRSVNEINLYVIVGTSYKVIFKDVNIFPIDTFFNKPTDES